MEINNELTNNDTLTDLVDGKFEVGHPTSNWKFDYKSAGIGGGVVAALVGIEELTRRLLFPKLKVKLAKRKEDRPVKKNYQVGDATACTEEAEFETEEMNPKRKK